MVDYTFEPTPVLSGSLVSTKWRHTWSLDILSEVQVLPVSALGPHVSGPVDSSVLVGGGFLFPDGVKGSVAAAALLLGSVGSPYRSVADPVVEGSVAVTGGLVVAAAVSPETTITVLSAIKQTFPLIDSLSGGTPEVLATSVLSFVQLDIPTGDARRSPPVVITKGTNALARPGNDAALNGSTNLSVAMLFDPMLIEAGASGTILSKHNAGATQAGWYAEWDDTTGEVTVRVCTSADGTTNYAARTTNVGTAADGTVGIRKREVVVFTYNSASPSLNLYVDGALSQGALTTVGSPGVINASTEPLAFMCDSPSTGGSNLLKGGFYLAAIWDVTLLAIDVAKIDRSGVLPADVVTADLQAAWTGLQMMSGGITDRYYRWFDDVNGWDIYPLAANDALWIVPTSSNFPFVQRNRWNTDFIDSADIRTASLLSTRLLSSNAPSRRLYNVARTNPNIADVDGWRVAQGDLSIVLIGVKPTGTNSVVMFECFGMRLSFDRPTRTVTLLLGSDNAGSGTPNETVTYTTSVYGIGEGQPFVLAFRYNSDTRKGTLFVGGRKYLEQSRVATNAFEDREGLELLDQADYIYAAAVPACLTDTQIESLLTGFSPTVYGSNIIGLQRFRYVPRNPGGLSSGGVGFTVQEYNADVNPPRPYPRLSDGSLTLSAQPADGDRFRMDDGYNLPVLFEFDSASSVTVTNQLRRVPIGGSVSVTLDNLASQINSAPFLDVVAAHVPFSDTVTVRAERGYYDSESLFNREITFPVNVSGNLSADGFNEGGLIEWNNVPQRAMLTPSVLYSFNVPEWNYVDTPYPVQEAIVEEDEVVISPIFGDPLPSIVSVTVSAVGHNIVAVANAGPTDAGPVVSWWEVELADGNTEVMAVADYNLDNSFSVNRNHTDAFQIPVGQDWQDRRIRFVVQAVADATQVWRSLYFRMEGDQFDNSEVTEIIVGGTEQARLAAIEDLIVTVAATATPVIQTEPDIKVSVRVSERSRYKLTKVFLDADEDFGPEFALMSVLDDFYRVGDEFQVHRVRLADIGFLDRLAVQFYGPGQEDLWWAIAYANSIVDAEDLRIGQVLFIPARTRVRKFLARRPAR